MVCHLVLFHLLVGLNINYILILSKDNEILPDYKVIFSSEKCKCSGISLQCSDHSPIGRASVIIKLKL